MMTEFLTTFAIFHDIEDDDEDEDDNEDEVLLLPLIIDLLFKETLGAEEAEE